MTHINLGVTALRAAQIGLNTAAQNIANASTEGYHRQRVDVVDRQTYHVGQGPVTGGGVDVAQIRRLRNATVEQALTANISGREAATAQLSTLQQIERVLTPGEGSVHSLVTEFFDRVEHLAANPSESVLRRELVSTAGQLAEAISHLAEAFDTFGGGVENETSVVVGEVNHLAQQIAEVNKNLRVAVSSGQTANSLLDQRDRLVNELASYVDVDPASLLNGSDPIVAAGGALIIAEVTTVISVSTSSDGRLQLASSTGQQGIDIRGGKLGGLMEASKAVSSGIGHDFADWVRTLIREIDTVQATGIGLTGPVATMAGHRQITPVDRPLSEANSLFEVSSGELAVTVTSPSGQRTTTVINVDTGTDSLQDVVRHLDGISGITASIADNGTVAMHTDSGFLFDFAGRTDQSPISQAISGTATPTVSGTFTGAQNTTWNAEVINGGEVGVSSDVIVRVTDSATGQVVGDFNFGLGYPANQAVEIADGVGFSMAPGTLNAGDAFSVRVTSQPDETGLLASLGLQSLFVGNRLGELRLNPGVNENPESLAASRSGTFGEGRQLDRLIDLRSRGLFSSDSESVEERLASITGLSGILAANSQLEIDQRSTRQLQLENARDSVSGVDPNEELLEMLQYQRAFQAASRFVTSIDEILDDLMSLIR